MGGTLGVTIVIRKQNLSWIKCADIVAPLLILGCAIGRVGCFLVGDDYGIPTLSFLGITFENGLPPTTYNIFQTYYPWVDLSGFGPGLLAVHPTQLYETTAGLAIFAFLWNKRTHVKVAGSLFFTYLILAYAYSWVRPWSLRMNFWGKWTWRSRCGHLKRFAPRGI